MQVRPLSSLTHAEVVDLAEHAAGREEPIEQANPFDPGCWRHAVFNDVFIACAADLQPIG